MLRTTLTFGEAVILALICFGLSIALSIDAVLSGFPTEPFTDANTIWALLTTVIEVTAALIFLRARRFDVAQVVPHPNFSGAAVGFGLFLATWVAGAIVTAPLSPSYSAQPIAEIMRGTAMSMSVIVAFAMVNGPFEEVFLLGVLVRGLRPYGLSIAIGFPLLVRILYHLYQGPTGAVWVAVDGLIFTLYYIRYGDMWPPVFAHILADIVPFAR